MPSAGIASSKPDISGADADLLGTALHRAAGAALISIMRSIA
jgi:hypothetical protein